MPDCKKDAGHPVAGSKTSQERKAALIRKIQAEMASLTPKDLERLYAAIALMENKKDTPE